MNNEKNKISYDKRLKSLIELVCDLLEIDEKNFASLALANLLEEEIEEIKDNKELQKRFDSKKIRNYGEIIEGVKLDSDFWD